MEPSATAPHERRVGGRLEEDGVDFTLRLSTISGHTADNRIEMEELKQSEFGKRRYPRNPLHRTGIRGRGRLGKWGPNYAADPVITRPHPVRKGLFQVLVAYHKKPKRRWYAVTTAAAAVAAFAEVRV